MRPQTIIGLEQQNAQLRGDAEDAHATARKSETEKDSIAIKNANLERVLNSLEVEKRKLEENLTAEQNALAQLQGSLDSSTSGSKRALDQFEAEKRSALAAQEARCVDHGRRGSSFSGFDID